MATKHSNTLAHNNTKTHKYTKSRYTKLTNTHIYRIHRLVPVSSNMTNTQSNKLAQHSMRGAKRTKQSFLSLHYIKHTCKKVVQEKYYNQLAKAIDSNSIVFQK